MARTHTVKSARKPQGRCMSPTCSHGRKEIEVGDPYKWFSIRSHRAGRGTRKVYHINCPVPPSHRTTSWQLGTIYDGQEAAQRSIPGDPEDDTSTLSNVAETFAEAVREAGEGYRESADNIESGFGHTTYVSDELTEKADSLESWADDLECLDFEDFYESDVDFEEPEREEDETDDEYELRVEEARDEAVSEAKQTWWDEQVSTLEEAIENSPL